MNKETLYLAEDLMEPGDRKENEMTNLVGQQIDPDEITAGIIAAKEAAANITYMGVSVGSRITDDEYKNIVTAIVVAVENYRAGSSI